MIKKLSVALLLSGSCCLVTPALAADRPFIFGATGANESENVYLTINGTQRFLAKDTGYLESRGWHGSLNSVYLTGRLDYLDNTYRSYFAFDLSGLISSQIASASISIRSGADNLVSPVTFMLSDVTTPLVELDRERPWPSSTEGQPIYEDLGTGVVYGTTSVEHLPYGQSGWTVVNLNEAFLDRLRNGSLSDVALGGSLVEAVPEPATWGLMLLGFGMVGASVRRRRTTPVTYA